MPLQKPQLIKKVKEDSCFSAVVNRYMEAKEITQAMLVERSQLSKTTISRVCRNCNDKGSTYSPANILVVLQISVGLGLSPKEFHELRLIAFPEEELMELILDQRLNIYEADEILVSNGCSSLLNIEE